LHISVRCKIFMCHHLCPEGNSEERCRIKWVSITYTFTTSDIEWISDPLWLTCKSLAKNFISPLQIYHYVSRDSPTDSAESYSCFWTAICSGSSHSVTLGSAQVSIREKKNKMTGCCLLTSAKAQQIQFAICLNHFDFKISTQINLTPLNPRPKRESRFKDHLLQ
jgi:hypothetical protein